MAGVIDHRPVRGSGQIAKIAQRRNETLENVPMTVQAVTGLTLSTLNVATLDGLLKYTPNVSYGNNGPGQGNIFMRGLSAGFAGDQCAKPGLSVRPMTRTP